MDTTTPTTSVPGSARAEEWLTVRRAKSADVGIVQIIGEVDLCTSGTVSSAVSSALGEHPSGLVIDLLGVTFCGCSGLTVLVDADEQARRSRKPLSLACTGRVVLRPLALTGLTERFRICETVPQAVQSLRQLSLAG
ncbi:anti-anti-sigma factor [Amycolatopsis marina]|uniref:Anti-sigma factor antagonist n=1 Tax=Amycolatopsis marina TaxID=490629 RepID=A0A1I0Z1Y6_9PSEU|nr:STAS domain-containing protein [Amycolatopsis marina]SFB19327.1 anti-anti-sigma factor [Amycolatopsis marina]